MTCGIYRITHRATGRHYVGQSLNIQRRWTDHKRDKDQHIDRALKKHGVELFEFAILEECLPEQLNERERHWITALDCFSPKGYNKTLGGQLNSGHTAENRKRFSESMKQRMKDPIMKERVALSRRGVPHTEEVRERLRQAAIKQYSDPAARLRASEITKSRMNDEMREHLSKKAKAQFSSPEARAAQARRTGIPQTDEVRAIISESSRSMWAREGHKEAAKQSIRQALRNPETKQKHIEAIKAAWARRKAAACVGVTK